MDLLPVHHFCATNGRRPVLRFSIMSIVLCLFIISACASDKAARNEKAEMQINIGAGYIEAGDNSGALKELLSAEKIAPTNPRVHYFLAIAYQGKGYQDKAIEECKKAIELKSDYSEAYNLLGTIYINKGNNELAIESFNKALGNIMYDTPAIALYNLGRAYYNLGDYAKSVSKYQEAIGKDIRRELLPLIENGLGKVGYAQGDYARAKAHFIKSTELAPTYVESQFLLAECYVKLGSIKEAKKSFETVVRLAPTTDLGHAARENINKLRK
ncbi:MAG: Cell division coordinator CpoB [Syntrophus sp. SKADARSKE-3]|nr:Cell division coordinator CpoB [Syntrophus sp. SKADARSKE-3]